MKPDGKLRSTTAKNDKRKKVSDFNIVKAFIMRILADPFKATKKNIQLIDKQTHENIRFILTKGSGFRQFIHDVKIKLWTISGQHFTLECL